MLLGDLYWKAADGTGEVEKLASSPGRALFPRSWSNDGKTLVLCEFSVVSNSEDITGGISQNARVYPYKEDIGILSMEGEHARKPLLQEKYSEIEPLISPDGRWMAYASDESGKPEVYVRPFPDVNQGKCLVSTSAGNSPLWSPDGRELFYHSGDAAMAVRVETDPTFKPGKPTVLFRGTHSKSTLSDDFTYWDISPDGKRFLMMKEAASTGVAPTAAGPRRINIVLNWFEELKQKVPGK
jgi:serine/threonine-protein kinase